MLEIIQNYLNRNNYNYGISTDEADKDIIYFNYTIRSSSFSVFLEIFRNVNMLKFFVYCPDVIPENKVSELLKLLNHINLSRSISHFVLLSDGHLRTQLNVMFGDEVPDISLDYIFHTFQLLDEFHPHILNVLINDITGEEQIKLIKTSGTIN